LSTSSMLASRQVNLFDFHFFPECAALLSFPIGLPRHCSSPGTVFLRCIRRIISLCSSPFFLPSCPPHGSLSLDSFPVLSVTWTPRWRSLSQHPSWPFHVCSTGPPPPPKMRSPPVTRCFPEHLFGDAFFALFPHSLASAFRTHPWEPPDFGKDLPNDFPPFQRPFLSN